MWEGIVQNICETIMVEKWLLDGWQVTPQEARIINRLKLALAMIAPDSWKPIPGRVDSCQIFMTPSEGLTKLSFKGASKGNPSPAGFNRIFQDYRAKVRLIYANQCVHVSNNEAKFVGSHQGLILAIKLGYRKLVVEGDSQLVINTLKKLS